MKAAIIEKPGVLVVRDTPDPKMGEYDALCQLLYGATCTGTDQHLIDGQFPWPLAYPTILGHESIGRVVTVGSRVRNFHTGDLVTRVGAPASLEISVNWGGFAEFGLARDHWAMQEDGRPEAEWRAARINQVLPPDTDPRAATMVITWRETLSYATRMGIGAGKRVLVIGSGGNGLSFTAHARNLGAVQIALIGSPEREMLGRAAGASIYCDYHTKDLAKLLSRSQPEGFDFIIDAVGKQGQVNRVLPALNPGGMLGIYGMDDYRTTAINPRLAPGSFTYYNGGYNEAETHAEVVSFMQRGLLDAMLWLDLDQIFSLDEIGKAFEMVHARKLVKALVKLSS